MKKIFILFLCSFFLGTFDINAQQISVGANFGFASPKGSGISEEPSDLNLDGGLVYTIDALYHLNPKFGVGLNYTTAGLVGAGSGDIDLFGMRLIGAKALYQLKDSGFRPYGALTLGAAQLSTPEYTVTVGTSTTKVPKSAGSGFGIMPEFGLSFGGFNVGVQYLLPTSYTIKEAAITDKAAGALNFVIGYRYAFSF